MNTLLRVFLTASLHCFIVTSSEDWHYSGNNIAHNKPVEQKPGTYSNYPAQLAVDGNRNTLFESGSCSHTEPAPNSNASWTVNLDKSYYFTGIVIFNRQEEYQRKRLRNFIVLGNDGYVLYNDTGKNLHAQLEIKIPLDGKKSFSSLTIWLSPHSGDPDGGRSILTLCEIEIYAVSVPTAPRFCEKFTSPSNGNTTIHPVGILAISYNKYPVGTVFEFTCHKNYRINGSANIECLRDGQYNASVPSCNRVSCDVFKPSNHSNFTPETTSYKLNTELTVTCDHGYRTNSPTNVIRCQNNGKWSGQPTCLPVQCDYPGKPANGYYVRVLSNKNMTYDSSALPYGTIIRGICDNGFEPNAYVERRCESKTSWTGQNPSCRPVRCNVPGIIENGDYFLANGSKYISGILVYNTVLNIKCIMGYTIEGQDKITCQRDKAWSPSIPVCKIKICKTPERFHNGFYTIQSPDPSEKGKLITLTDSITSEYMTKLYVQCTSGNILNSTVTSRKCLVSGSWSGETPVCFPITCKWPLHIYGGYYIHVPPHVSTSVEMPYNTTLTAGCNENFKLSNDFRKRRCDENGNWTNERAICEPLCLLPHVSNARVLRGSTFYEVGSSVRVLCDEGFSLSPEQNITCLDTHKWSGSPRCIALTKPDAQDKYGMIAGVTVTIVIVLLSALALAVFLYRRRKRKMLQKSAVDIRNTKPTEREDSDQNGSWLEFENIQDSNVHTDNALIHKDDMAVSKHGHSYSNTLLRQPEDQPIKTDRTYYNFTNDEKIPKAAIKVKDLSDLVLYAQDAKENFEKQFKGFPRGMTGPHTEALKPQNRGKNRYKNLYACKYSLKNDLTIGPYYMYSSIEEFDAIQYDDTRVILDTEDVSQSDYINACYVHGFGRIRKYIASQGPTKEILADFWKMIWTEDCSKIVMLTNLFEEGKTKCEQYWPDEGCETYGNITVTMTSTEIFSQFVIRVLTAHIKDTSVSKTVVQFHFTAWPDKGVPKYASSLVQFLHKVKHVPEEGSGSIVVHCSAGVGRTGTFIALDILSDQGSSTDYIDVVGTVAALRKQRVNLVQTLEQYIFVHYALIESLMLPTSALPAAKFPEAFQDLLEVDQTRKKRKICLEFETLKKMSPVADEYQYVSSKLVRNREKNRYSNVLPVEEFMPKITSGDWTSDRNYINAVFLPSYKESKAFIITQTPLESTRDDFWRLIWEHNIHTVVMMNNLEEMQDSEVYWPVERKEVKFGKLMIRNDGAEELNEHRMLSLTIKNDIQTRYIKSIHCGGWKCQKSLPESPDVILALMELVQTWQQQSGNHTILLHCMNGVDKSGLFCVISAVIERMKIEQDVAISHVIEEMRNAREQIIPSVDHYKFCHEAVLAFLQQYDTYANFAA